MIVLGLVIFAFVVGFAIGYLVGAIREERALGDEIAGETKEAMEQFDADRQAAYEYFRRRCI